MMQLYENIIKRLRATRRKENSVLMLSGFLNTLIITASVLLVVTLLETIANGDSVFRGILFLIVLIGFLLGAVFFLLPYILRSSGIKNKQSLDVIALRIGDIYPDLKDRLCNVIQLIRRIEKKEGTSASLALTAFNQTAGIAAGKNFDAIIDRKNLKKVLLYFLIVSSITAGIFGIFSSTVGASFYRIINWDKSFEPPPPFSLTIEPVFARILKGESIRILVRAIGNSPDNITIFIKEENQEEYDTYTLPKDSGGIYKYEIVSLKRSISFFAEAQWLSSPVRTSEGKIIVTDKPLVKSIAGKIIYPAYTKLSPKTFTEQNGDISALHGSRLEFSLLSNKELKEAKIAFEKTSAVRGSNDSVILKSDTLYVPMSVSGRQAFGSIAVQQSGSYYFLLRDKEGQESTEPVRYDLIALNDEYPSITLEYPTTDVQVSEDAALVIKTSIADDFGFSGLKLNYRLVESKYSAPTDKFSQLNIPLLSDENAAVVSYIWDLNRLNISPSDKYEFYLEVFDNDRISGPKSTKTTILSVKLPALEEVLQTADEQQQKIEKDIEKVLKKTEDVKKEMEQLNRDLQKKQNPAALDWKEKKKAEDILKKQAEIQSKLSDIQKSLEEMTKNLDENKLLSPETLQKYMELQKLLREVNSPELKKMQERMQEAINKMTPEELQKAMKNVKFDEEQFRKSIERTMKILQRLKAEQKVDALTKRAEELQKKMEELDKQLQNSNPQDKQKRDELAKQQEAMKDEVKSIKKELNELEKLMKEIGDNMPMKELDKAQEELNADETSQEMEDSEQDIKDGNFNKARQSQRKPKSKVNNFAEQMKKLKKEMENKITKEAIRKLQKAVNDLLQLSKNQEEAKSKTRSSDYNSTQYNEITDEQAELLESMMNVANSMMELSNKSFAVTPEMGKELGNSIQKMQQALQQLANRQTQAASQSQEGAMSAMNSAAMQMQQMLSMMQGQGEGSCNNPGGSGQGGQGQQPSGGGGFMEKLQQLASQQQGINQSLQQMQQPGNSGKFTQEQQAQLGRIAAEQGRAQKTLEELSREQKQSGGEKKTLGDLERLAQEMKEIVSDLQSGRITPETMKRQDRILSRLLDATRSMHERDYEKKRESRTGKEFTRQSPEALDLKNQEGWNNALQDLLRSMQQGYTKDYEELIRQYFEALNPIRN